MPTPLTQSRIAAGLCAKCGRPRAGERVTARLCESCAQNMRRWATEKRRRAQIPIRTLTGKDARTVAVELRDTRRAADLCVTCGRPWHLRDPRNGHVNCGACRVGNRLRTGKHHQLLRDRKAGVLPGGRHWPVGEHPANLQGGARACAFGLDYAARDALFTLHRLYREREIAAGRAPKSRILSKLIRDVLHPWLDRRSPSGRHGPTLLFLHIRPSLDGPSRAAIRRIADDGFGGNKSAALRCLLVAALPKPMASAGKRTGAFPSEPQ